MPAREQLPEALKGLERYVPTAAGLLPHSEGWVVRLPHLAPAQHVAELVEAAAAEFLKRAKTCRDLDVERPDDPTLIAKATAYEHCARIVREPLPTEQPEETDHAS